VYVRPAVTTAGELKALLAKQSSSGDPPFAGVYAVGPFPGTTSAPGGYQVIPIKDL
jgi:hypothetical protein